MGDAQAFDPVRMARAFIDATVTAGMGSWQRAGERHRAQSISGLSKASEMISYRLGRY